MEIVSPGNLFGSCPGIRYISSVAEGYFCRTVHQHTSRVVLMPLFWKSLNKSPVWPARFRQGRPAFQTDAMLYGRPVYPLIIGCPCRSANGWPKGVFLPELKLHRNQIANEENTTELGKEKINSRSNCNPFHYRFSVLIELCYKIYLKNRNRTLKTVIILSDVSVMKNLPNKKLIHECRLARFEWL